MKVLCQLMFFLLSVSVCHGKDIQWTHHAEEGEDATSTHYYFFLSNGESIERVRWVWNGGAQNKPEITEFLLNEGGRITIRTAEADRRHVKALIAGRDVSWSLKQEYFIITANTARMLIPPPPDKTLTDQQRIDLYNLISILAKERNPLADKK